MKRFHVHVSVADIEQSVRFYSTLFGSAPARLEPDYAKWMLDDPRINFAISRRDGGKGIDHIGLQVDTAGELAGLRDRLLQADAAVLDEAGANCCYARSDKHWVTDPTGIPWETFHTLGDIPTFNGRMSSGSTDVRHGLAAIPVRSAEACCAPASAVADSCCTSG
jgi:catechol 2,3-dioxygenase-like lactoylglutathione lyase family enzyme